MKSGHTYYVYIVECQDGLYYSGFTNDLERRLWKHNNGINQRCFTYKRRPVFLKYEEHFHDIKMQFHGNSKLKNGQGKRRNLCLLKIGK